MELAPSESGAKVAQRARSFEVGDLAKIRLDVNGLRLQLIAVVVRIKVSLPWIAKDADDAHGARLLSVLIE